MIETEIVYFLLNGPLFSGLHLDKNPRWWTRSTFDQNFMELSGYIYTHRELMTVQTLQKGSIYCIACFGLLLSIENDSIVRNRVKKCIYSAFEIPRWCVDTCQNELWLRYEAFLVMPSENMPESLIFVSLDVFADILYVGANTGSRETPSPKTSKRHLFRWRAKFINGGIRLCWRAKILSSSLPGWKWSAYIYTSTSFQPYAGILWVSV